MELELSNYWDDFKERVNETIDCLQKGELPGLDRLTVHLTEQCNFRCDSCNMRFSKRTMEKELAKKMGGWVEAELRGDVLAIKLSLKECSR